MSSGGSDRSPSGRVKEPPLYFLSGSAALHDGDHSNDTWHARVAHADIAGYTLPMIVKRLDSQVTLAVELACGLAARELRLNVPQPGLVVADREDLPGLDDDVEGDRFLLVGSHYQRPDALFAKTLENNPAADELVWESVCTDGIGLQGAAWDELIANPDRHTENMLFDGTTWWLFDHDQALEPAHTIGDDHQIPEARQAVVAHNAKVNQLAQELMRRYSGQYTAILAQTKRLDSGERRLRALAHYAYTWTHDDAEIRDVLQLCGVVLGLIHLRLPALGEKLQMRVGQPGTPPLWK